MFNKLNVRHNKLAATYVAHASAHAIDTAIGVVGDAHLVSWSADDLVTISGWTASYNEIIFIITIALPWFIYGNV